MASALRHRGPDDHGIWADAAAGVALGHCRLSILDLSPTGHQPMIARDARWVVAYNGEIYNHESLRRDLKEQGAVFRGTSDTEVAVEAIAHWGVEASVRKFVGMFAFALWDRRKRELWLIRDRLGIKPLYYGWVGSTFVFGSEMKAVSAFEGFRATLDPLVLAPYLRYGFVPSPRSAFQGMRVLVPGSLLCVRSDSTEENTVPRAYWSLRTASDPVAGRQDRDDSEVDDLLDGALREAIRLRMVADVPVGAFLSGGIDSSLVVALMQQIADRPTRTFTIGFHEQEYDEAPKAAAVARHLRTDHTEVYLSDRQAMEVVPRLAEIWDEPFADSSQIPAFLVAKVARQDVAVTLSGDGGDELFGGYTRYPKVNRHWHRAARCDPARLLLARGLRCLVAPQKAGLRAVVARFLTLGGTPATLLRARLEWRARLLAEGTLPGFYHRHPALVPNPVVAGVLGGAEDDEALALTEVPPPYLSPIEQMMFIDTLRYLPDDILTKVDRASMAVSLEVRVPLLDHRVVELAWQLPFAQRVGCPPGKAAMRRLLARYVPPKIFERPKMGFGIPFGEWLRGGLRDWAESLLEPADLAASGWFDVPFVRARWREHLDGTVDHRNLIWAVLMLQAWRQRWRVT